MKRIERHVSTIIKNRGCATRAAAQQQAEEVVYKPKLSALPNGTIVAALEDHSLLSRIGVIFQAGARFETGEYLGVTHAIRSASSLSTKNATQFGITRNVEQTGGHIKCTTTREQMMYTLDCRSNLLEKNLPFLSEMAAAGIFFPWEVKEKLEPQIAFDLQMLARSPEALLMEELSKVAYRKGLGNSLYMKQCQLGNHTPELMSDFLDANYRTGNMCVVGTGVSHDDLSSFAKKLAWDHLEEGTQAVETSKFHGGEQRLETNDNIAYAAIVSEGTSLSDPDRVPLAVLQYIMGSSEPSIKYGDGPATSRLVKAVKGSTSGPCSVTCLNSSFSDSGMFGFKVAANPKEMEPVLRAAVKAMAEATKGVTDEEVQRAKNQLKSALLMQGEQEGAFGMLVTEAIKAVQKDESGDLLAAIDSVTTQQVQSVAKRVINTKPAMAAVGKTYWTPYLDELM